MVSHRRDERASDVLPPDLARLAETWPELPENIRSAIMLLAESSRQENGGHE